MRIFLAALLVLNLGLGRTGAQDFDSATERRVAETVSALSAKKKSGGALRRKFAGAALALCMLGSACGGTVVAPADRSDGCQWADQAFSKGAEAVLRLNSERQGMPHETLRKLEDLSKESRQALGNAESTSGKCDPAQKALFTKEVGALLSDLDEALVFYREAYNKYDEEKARPFVSRGTLYADLAVIKLVALQEQAQKIKSGENLDSTDPFPPAATCVLMRGAVDQLKQAQAQMDKGQRLFETAVQQRQSTAEARAVLDEAHRLYEGTKALYDLLNDGRPGNCDQRKQSQLNGIANVLGALAQQERQLKIALEREGSPISVKPFLGLASDQSKKAATLLEVLEVELMGGQGK